MGATPDDSTQAIHEMLNNYKMCTTTDFSENDDAVVTRFGTAGDLGTLSAALATADELVNAAPKSSGRPVTDVDGAKLFGHPAPRATRCCRCGRVLRRSARSRRPGHDVERRTACFHASEMPDTGEPNGLESGVRLRGGNDVYLPEASERSAAALLAVHALGVHRVLRILARRGRLA